MRLRQHFRHYEKPRFKKVKPKWLITDEKNRLELDLYNEELNLAIEYNGMQHYKYIPFFHRNKGDFEKGQRYDKLKKDLCKKNNVNLVIIHYSENNIPEYLCKKLDKLNIDYNKNIDDEYDKEGCKMIELSQLIESKNVKQH